MIQDGQMLTGPSRLSTPSVLPSRGVVEPVQIVDKAVDGPPRGRHTDSPLSYMEMSDETRKD